jgi:hypothetical protein
VLSPSPKTIGNSAPWSSRSWRQTSYPFRPGS